MFAGDASGCHGTAMSARPSLSVLTTAISAGTWAWLAFARGSFWRLRPRLPRSPTAPPRWPSVAIVVPARNEAATLPTTLPTLARQSYEGSWQAVLVDDQSEDGTAERARAVAAEAGLDMLQVVPGTSTPPGWSGKVWAMEQGFRRAREAGAEFVLFTDADITHPPDALRRLVSLAETGGFDLVSVMVKLRAQTFWERLLIPPFVYFFAKLSPFPWVADPHRRTAAAAGGCLLVRRAQLEASGGLAQIRDAVIDDCALARIMKDHGGRLWLGVSEDWESVRSYARLRAIREMVVRSAYAQLRYSPLLLVLTVAGMLSTYLVPPAASLLGLARRRPGLLALGAFAWGTMASTFVPTLRWFRLSPLRAPLLPAAALLYTAFTLESGLRWHLGRPVRWRGRRVGRSRARRTVSRRPPEAHPTGGS